MADKINQLKIDILNASYEAKACHIGSALGCVGILVDIFDNLLKDGDIFIFSKASGVGAYYALLADRGMFPKEKLSYYLKEYPLPSTEVPGVVHSFGSLGHGLPIAVGLAYAQPEHNIYVLMSDGECQEGTTYESALFAGQHRLDNLHVIIDNNGLQACGSTDDIMSLWTAFRFLSDTLPNVEIVVTTKGEGVLFMEDEYEWHYKNLTEDQLKEAINGLS